MLFQDMLVYAAWNYMQPLKGDYVVADMFANEIKDSVSRIDCMIC